MAKNKPESERPKVAPKFSKDELASAVEADQLRQRNAEKPKWEEENRILEHNAELFRQHEAQIAELFKERLLKAGFTKAELEGMEHRQSKNPLFSDLPGRPLIVDASDPRLEALEEAEKLYRLEWRKMIELLGIKSDDEAATVQVDQPIGTEALSLLPEQAKADGQSIPTKVEKESAKNRTRDFTKQARAYIYSKDYRTGVRLPDKERLSARELVKELNDRIPNLVWKEVDVRQARTKVGKMVLKAKKEGTDLAAVFPPDDDV